MDNIEIVKELTETTERSKSNTHQINELKVKVSEIDRRDEAIYKIASSVEVIANDVGHMKQDISEVKASQEEVKQELTDVKNAPDRAKAKLLSKITNKGLDYFLVGLFGFIFAKMFPLIFK